MRVGTFCLSLCQVALAPLAGTIPHGKLQGPGMQLKSLSVWPVLCMPLSAVVFVLETFEGNPQHLGDFFLDINDKLGPSEPFL